MFPGGGATTAPLITTLGRQPDVVVGKPNAFMLDLLIERYGDCGVVKYTVAAPTNIALCFHSHHFDRKRTVMIGDRLDTDILFGQRGGLSTLLVFSGVATPEDYRSASNEIRADYTAQSIGHLFEMWQQRSKK
jgi:ribonucleotide monophosphatase NagD (HAD superfamily)